MRRRLARTVGAVIAAGATLLAVVAGPAQATEDGAATSGAASPTAATATAPLPVFEFSGIITDKAEMIYNPTNEYVFPSVFHAGAHLEDPLGEWYLYFGPHDAPGGIMLMYADSLAGPWTEYAANPVIDRYWDPHHRVSHIASPDVVWDDTTGEMVVYYHGENTETRYATSTDGISFEYGGLALTAAMTAPDSTSASYARVFEHPDPDSGYAWASFFTSNFSDGPLHIMLAESVDGRSWTVHPEPLVAPATGDGGNIAAANLWEWEGQLYVLYHNSNGRIMARTIDRSLREVGPATVLFRTSGVGEDVGRAAAPEIVTDAGGTYLFYESGPRLRGTMAYATLNPDAVRPPDPASGFPRDPANPVFEQCAVAGSDEFDGTGPGLDPAIWDRVVRAESARHVVGDGVLTIPTYATGVAGAPLPQQELPDGPWQLTTQVSIDVAERFQQAGLLLYTSDTSYGQFAIGQTTFGERLTVTRVLDGVRREDTLAPEVPDTDTLWMRLSSDGETVQPSVSYDGATFTDVGRPFTMSESGFTHVGPYAFRGATAAPEIPATFDWIRWSPTAEQYEACLAPEEPGEPGALPTFGFTDVLTVPEEMLYNPTGEFIFPSVFHAGAHLEDPLGEYYLYFGPHDAPGGISLMYADSLAGPWTEYAANPVVDRQWDPHYSVSHVASADAIWNEEAGQLFLYFHGENSTTRYATSDDGVTFTYGGVTWTNASGGAGVTESSYARVFEHPDPTSGYGYAAFYMANYTDNVRRIRLAESVDGRTWTVVPGNLVSPEQGDGGNVSAGNLWEWDGQLYVTYHNSSGQIRARTIDPTLRQVGPSVLLHASSGIAPDVGRVASPEIVTDATGTYLFYEAGARLDARIALATLGAPGPEEPAPLFPVDPANPVFEQCPGIGSDEFDGTGPGLDPGLWDRVVREGSARHVVGDGVLTIPTYATGVAGAPLPQQELPDGPWQLTTQVTIDVAERFQQAGLLLYAADTVYGKFGLGQATPGKRLEVVQQNGSSSRQDTEPPAVPEADTLWLRLTSDGASVQASVSYDGATFADFGRPLSLATTPFTHVGPYAFRGATAAPEIEATFDWFRWSPSAAEYEACLAPEEPEPLFPVDPANPVFERCPGVGSDEFDGAGPGLDPGLWDRVVREESARHVVGGGVLTIPTYRTGVAGAPLPQQELPEGPWQLTTQVTIDVAARFQQAGVLLYASDAVYAKVDLVQATPGKRLEVVQMVDGVQRQDTVEPAVPEADTVSLRLTSDGAAVQPSVSYDGATFTDLGRSFSSALGFTHVGPFAFRGATDAPEIDATFDWWRWSPSVQEYAACLAEPEPEPEAPVGDGPGRSQSAPGLNRVPVVVPAPGVPGGVTVQVPGVAADAVGRTGPVRGGPTG